MTPFEDADGEDPMELVGVAVPADAESQREMAYVFAEEFARLGEGGARILRLFQNPFYAGANAAYRALGLDWEYFPVEVDGTSLAAFIDSRDEAWRGLSLTMPLKQDVIPLLDELDASATAIQSVNTIVNTDGHLTGYNTDYIAVRSVLAGHQVPTELDFLVLGAGGMAKAIVAALRDTGFGSGTIVRHLTHPAFAVPTTIDRAAGRFYLPNARFGIPNPDSAAFQVVNLGQG